MVTRAAPLESALGAGLELGDCGGGTIPQLTSSRSAPRHSEVFTQSQSQGDALQPVTLTEGAAVQESEDSESEDNESADSGSIDEEYEQRLAETDEE